MKHEKSTAHRGKAKRNGTGDPLGTNSEIGRKLKQYYDELVAEEVTERFMQLLSQLEEKERAQQPAEKD